MTRSEAVGIEPTCSGTVTGGDYKGLRDVAEAAGDDFLAGNALHTGTTAGPFAERLWAVPIENLRI